MKPKEVVVQPQTKVVYARPGLPLATAIPLILLLAFVFRALYISLVFEMPFFAALATSIDVIHDFYMDHPAICKGVVFAFLGYVFMSVAARMVRFAIVATLIWLAISTLKHM